MSLFNKPGSERPILRSDTPSSEAGLSVIAAGMKVIGDIESAGVIKVDGIVEGSVRGARQLLLGRSGFIQGDVNADEAVIGGRVVGTIVALQRVEIQGTSSVEGDIHTKSIVVLEGGVINGSVRMEDVATRSAISAPSASPRATLALTQ